MSMITIRPIEATLTHDSSNFCRMDPYCKIYMGEIEQQTQICKNGAKNPKWEQSLRFNTSDTNLRAQVWDRDAVGKDMLVGSGAITVERSMCQGGNSSWIDLQFEGKSAGRLHISCQCEGCLGVGQNTGIKTEYPGGTCTKNQGSGSPGMKAEYPGGTCAKKETTGVATECPGGICSTKQEGSPGMVETTGIKTESPGGTWAKGEGSPGVQETTGMKTECHQQHQHGSGGNCKKNEGSPDRKGTTGVKTECPGGTCHTKQVV